MAWHQVSSETELLPLNDDDDSYDDGHNKRAPVLWGHYQSIIRLEPPPVRTAPFDDQSKVMWTGRNWLLQDYRNQNTPADARCTIGVIDEAQCLQKILQTSVQGLSHCEHDFAIRVFVPTKENKEIVPFTIVMAPPVLMPATCIELRHLKREDQRGKADPTTKGVTSEGLARIDAALAMGLVMRISVMATCRLTLITVPVKSTLQRYQQFLEHLAAMATNHRIAAANLRRSAVYCHLYRGEPQVAANERQHLMSNLPYLSVKQRAVGGVRKDLLFWTAADRLHDVRHVWCRIDDRDNIDVDDARDLTQLLLEGTSQTVENLRVALLRQVRVSLSCDRWSRRAAGSMSWVLSPTGVEGAPVQNGSLQRSTSNSIGYEVRMGYENGAVGCVLEWTSATKDTIRLIEGLNGPLSNLTTDAGSPPRRAPHLAVVYVTGSQQLQVNIDLTLKRQPPFLEEECCPLSRTVCLPPKYRYPDDDDALVVTATYENGVIVIRISGFLMRYDL